MVNFGTSSHHEIRCCPPPIIFAFSLLIVATACNKEVAVKPSSDTTANSIEQLNSAFDPPQSDVMGFIREFEQQKRDFAETRSEGEKPLAEALWICEADLNYSRGDAGVRLDTLVRDSIFFVLPVRPDEYGQYWVNNGDLIAKQAELFGLIPYEGERTVRFVDIALVHLTEEQALFRAYINRRPPGGGGEVELPIGSFPLGQEEWVHVMDQYIYANDFRACPHSFFVSISDPVFIFDNDWYSLYGGYSAYTGSNAPVGPALIPQGPAGELVWFPAQWHKHLALRQWYYDQFVLVPGRRLINERYVQWYEPTAGVPMDYGSPYYPMGPWTSRFEFKRAIEICPGNLPGEE